MEIKSIKLSPKKNGLGYVTSYSVNLGSAEVRDVGFIDSTGSMVEIEKVIDEENKEIKFRIKAKQ